MAALSDPASFLTGANSAFLEDLYGRFLADASSVDPEWQKFFRSLGDESGVVARRPSWGRPFLLEPGEAVATRGRGRAAGDSRDAALDSIRARMMIRAYRVRGHLGASLDPLGIAGGERYQELDPAYYGFGDGDMDRPIFLDRALGDEFMTARDIVARLRETYCGTIGYEYMHIQDPAVRNWLQVRIEDKDFRPRYAAASKRAILQQLTAAESFERFLHIKYTGTKRFGVDGAESLMPALEAIVDRAAQHKVDEIVLGMPHRGRLNVLANLVKKPVTAILAEFEGVPSVPGDVQGSGDVKYHLGTSADREFNGHTVHLSLTANPSHLEAVDPVVAGKVRAKQYLRGDEAERKRVMGLLMHGDAAFAGQGIVAECLGLSELRGYRTGGTVHVIVNNQIGFTTSPGYSRSSPYPSDVAKSVQAPILHVNGDDPEAVTHAAKIATDYRQKFGGDVVLDMFCYRRLGHNEGDEPAFTQPIMYRKIAAHPSTRQIYADRLVSEGVLARDEPDRMVADVLAGFENDYAAAKAYRPNKADWLEGRWAGFHRAYGDARRGKTGVAHKVLTEIGTAITRYPEGWNLHPTLKRIIARRKATIDDGEGLDWATCEALAFGSLLLEGFPVRLSGQDSGRGTFSHRHSVFVDQVSEERYLPFNHIAEGQARYEVIDSMLSEFAVLGFEYGYSLSDPNALVLWEGQFGDFANGAQVIVDQFLASAESKWLRMSGLVLLLPHGQEGQGPEHSSARLERYLQLCAEDNLQVINPSTPASYFHALRRQLHRNFRKPLIVMAPKSLLRHKRAVSGFADLGSGRTFHRVLWDDHAGLKPDSGIRRVVLCSGKVYYDLLEARERDGIDDVYVMRLEQLYPFPEFALKDELMRFPKADLVWCQEEPKNAGAWAFLLPRLETLLDEMEMKVR
ncbi:MAG: 2-oxoglutarate dehydrogenase E1 component, partial [Proteobacteria bacterium]|nr:2-oxoglutarate dehydrogenase E1 component [Pseudomonadota bacterium]